MEAKVDVIASELAALTQRFLELSGKLGEAARALEESGAPPSNGLVEALAVARGQFVQLRTDALTAAESAGVAPAAEPQSLHDLEPILVAIEEAIRARQRREALEKLQAAALSVLDRALEIVHRDDQQYPALVECRARAQQLRAAVLALTELESDDTRRVAEGVSAFSDLLTMIENREALDDERYAHLEQSVSGHFGRSLAVAVARGHLGFVGDVFDPEPPAPAEAGAPEPGLAPEPVMVEVQPPAAIEPPPEVETSLEPPVEPPPAEPELGPSHGESVVTELEAEPAVVAAPEPAPSPVESSAPDETAQWWLAAWARWSGWRSTQDFAPAAREELGKYPYLLSVPIQRSPEYEDGLLAYGYSILMDHVEKQKPGCVGNALNSLKPGQTRPVGDQLYEYLVAEGRLRETYADFVRDTLLAVVPEPGVWFQFRILDSKEDTRILQRPSARIGDTELSGQRLASDGQRFAEHKFKMTLGPFTTRVVLVSHDSREARGAGFQLRANGAPSDSAWIVSVAAGTRAAGRTESRRIVENGLHVPGLGRDFSALWVAIFNPDATAALRYELSVFLRKDTRSPFRGKG
jgi:hypothetical protein